MRRRAGGRPRLAEDEETPEAGDFRPSRPSRSERPSRTHARSHARTHANGASGRDARPPKRDASEARPRKHNFITKLVNQWFDRVVGAMKGDGLEQAEAVYEPHRTTRDFIWNSIGAGAWAAVFPVVTMASTQLIGVERAGMVSMAFVVGLLLMFIGNFGVRTYQISDITMEHSFKDYQANRWATCIIMLVAGWLWCSIRGYTDEMFNITMGVILYRFVDALADVYEGRLQQVDKLYLAGISQTLRSVAALAVFVVMLLVAHDPVFACWGMAIAAAVTFVVVTWPLTLMEAPPSHPFSMQSFKRLFRACAPLFIAIFMFNLIENMPKFWMEGMLPYDNQLYYNAIYFPAQMILIAAQLVYKPLLLRMAGVWQDAKKRMKFDLILVGIVAIIAAITGVACAIMAWVGIPVMNFLYGIDFRPFRGLLFLMLITGGITAAIDFLYQVVTIMRRQKDVTVLYIVTFGFSLFIPFLLIRYAELEGAVLSYVIIEAILFVLLVWEYFRIRHDLAHGASHDEADADAGAAAGGSGGSAGDAHTRPSMLDLIDPALDGVIGEETLELPPDKRASAPHKPRPSEIRAERERRAEIVRRRTHGR